MAREGSLSAQEDLQMFDAPARRWCWRNEGGSEKEAVFLGVPRDDTSSGDDHRCSAQSPMMTTRSNRRRVILTTNK